MSHIVSMVPYTLGSPVLPTQCLIWTRPGVLLIIGLSASLDSNQKYKYPFFPTVISNSCMIFFHFNVRRRYIDYSGLDLDCLFVCF